MRLENLPEGINSEHVEFLAKLMLLLLADNLKISKAFEDDLARYFSEKFFDLVFEERMEFLNSMRETEKTENERVYFELINLS